MANELTIQFKLQGSKNGVVITNNGSPGSKTQTMQSTLDVLHHTTQDVGTSAEALSTGDVSLAAEHWALLVNRDATNYVDVESHKDGSNYATVARMRPGEPFLARLSVQSAGYPCIKLKANSAACAVEVIVCEAGDPAL